MHILALFSQLLLASISSEVQIKRGSEKTFSECQGVSNVFPSAAKIHTWLLVSSFVEFILHQAYGHKATLQKYEQAILNKAVIINGLCKNRCFGLTGASSKLQHTSCCAPEGYLRILVAIQILL